MNALTGVLNNPITRKVGWTLLHSVWEGALAGLVFAGLRAALRRRSARVRYVAGCVCLAALVVAPVLTTALGSGAAAGATSNGSDWSARSDRSDIAAPFHSASSGAVGFSPGWSAGSSAGFFTAVAPWLAAGWALGVVFCSARLARGYRWVRVARTREHEAVEPAWLATLDDLRRRLGVSRPVRLLKSALVEVPTVVGWLRPMILLPASTLSGLTPSQLEAILAHELAHVRRLDYLVNAVQCVIETLMFYHPVAWWISRSIREERENCCDDLVVEVCGDRVGYARALATLEGLRAELPGWAFAASGGSLLARIRRLLRIGDERGAISVREVSGLALLGVGLLLIILGIRMLLVPANYEATARIRVQRDQSEISGLGSQGGPASYDPYFIQTEFEVLQSEVILRKVIEDLDLNHHWGQRYANGERLKTSECMQMLRARLNLRAVPNTSLIEIRVHDEKPEEAAAIANAITEAYRSYRLQRSLALSKGGIQALEERFKDQEAKVRQAQEQVDRLREQLGINNAVPAAAEAAPSGENAPAPIMTAEMLRTLESKRIETKADYVRQETLLARLRSLQQDSSSEKFAQAVTTVLPDTSLSELLDEESQAAQKLVALQQDYGKEHPDVVRCEALVRDLQNRVKERSDGVMAGLAAKVFALSNSVLSVEAGIAAANSNDWAKVSVTRSYRNAVQTLDELQRFRQVLDTKIANEKVDLSMPKSPVVEIVDRAVPALRPSSPNSFQAAALIAVGLLLDLAGLLLLTGRGGRRMNYE